jgi:predicted DNA-binding mobile mystery protein A
MTAEQRKLLVQALEVSIGGGAGTVSMNTPTTGWLRAVRQALGITQSQLAKKLGIRQQAYANIEVREQKGKVTLEILRRAAGALDCDLIYAFVPKKAIATTYSGLAAKYDSGLAMRKATEHSMALEGQGRHNIAPKPETHE